MPLNRSHYSGGVCMTQTKLVRLVVRILLPTRQSSSILRSSTPSRVTSLLTMRHFCCTFFTIFCIVIPLSQADISVQIVKHFPCSPSRGRQLDRCFRIRGGSAGPIRFFRSQPRRFEDKVPQLQGDVDRNPGSGRRPAMLSNDWWPGGGESCYCNRQMLHCAALHPISESDFV